LFADGEIDKKILNTPGKVLIKAGEKRLLFIP